jgi:uncharacterized protein YgbK (DUF1537 family)
MSIPDALLCGSAGLVGALTARATGHRIAEAGSSLAIPGDCSGQGRQSLRTLLVVGSGSNAAHRQIEALAQQATIIQLDAEYSFATLVERCEPSGPAWLLHLPKPAPNAALEGPQARHWAEHLGKAALTLVEHLHPTLLILSGGDTAVTVLAQLEIDRLTVQAELLAGMPLCSAVTGSGRLVHVIMKPGSFGDDQTFTTLLERAARFLSSLPD